MSLAWWPRPAAFWPGLPCAAGLRLLRLPRGVLGSSRPLVTLEPRLPFRPPIRGLQQMHTPRTQACTARYQAYPHPYLMQLHLLQHLHQAHFRHTP